MPQAPENDSTTEPDAPPLPGGLAVRECSPGVLVEHPDLQKEMVGLRVIAGISPPGERGVWVMLRGAGVMRSVPPEAIALDLSHKVGRQHAALYCFENGPAHLFQDVYLTLYDAACGWPCDVARLRSLVEIIAARLEAEAEAARHRIVEWRTGDGVPIVSLPEVTNG